MKKIILVLVFLFLFGCNKIKNENTKELEMIKINNCSEIKEGYCFEGSKKNIFYKESFFHNKWGTVTNITELDGVDKDTFVILSKNYAKDKNYVYKYGRKE